MKAVKTGTETPVYIVGFRVRKDSDGVDFYALYLMCPRDETQSDRLAMDRQGRILVFTEREIAKRIRTLDPGLSKYGLSRKRPYVYDIEKVLSSVACGNENEVDLVVDFASLLLDCLEALERQHPSAFGRFRHIPVDQYHTKSRAPIAIYKRILGHLLADQLENSSIEHMLRKRRYRRSDLLDAFSWALGAVIRFVRVVP